MNELAERAPFYGYDEAEQEKLQAGLGAAFELVQRQHEMFAYFGLAKQSPFRDAIDLIVEAHGMVLRKRSQ